MENIKIQDHLKSLTAMVNDARGSLFGQDKCLVDREQLLELIEAIEKELPEEIENSKNVVENCDALRTNAKKEASNIRREASQTLQEAQGQAAKLVEDHSIVVLAKQREKEILTGAEQQRDQMVAGAISYSDKVLSDAQTCMNDTMQALGRGVATLLKQAQDQFTASLKQLEEARAVLQVAEQNRVNASNKS